VDVPDIHPNVSEAQASAASRALVEMMVLTPSANRGEVFDATLRKGLYNNTPGLLGSGVSVSVGAGTGFEPVTFRL